MLHSRYCAFGDPGQLKKTRNVLLDADGIDLEQVCGSVGTPGLASALESV